MTDTPRISAEDAKRATQQGDALLVCAYDDEQKCEDAKLDGSISYPELQRRLDDVPKDRELVFF